MGTMNIPVSWQPRMAGLAPDQRALVQAAMAASLNADPRTSRFQVGAVASTANGVTYAGVNVDSGPHANSVCAERIAMGAARAAEGEHLRLSQVTIFADAINCPPCGSCRQALHDQDPDLAVVFPLHRRFERLTAAALLPDAPQITVDEHAQYGTGARYADLVAAAQAAEAQAYSPFTRVASGAAVLCASGHFYSGTAVQSAAFGRNSTTAELNAITAARLVEGDALRIIAVASSSAMRCGAPDGTSRQSLLEFAAPRAVAIYPRYGRYRTVQLTSLLPLAFDHVGSETPSQPPPDG